MDGMKGLFYCCCMCLFEEFECSLRRDILAVISLRSFVSVKIECVLFVCDEYEKIYMIIVIKCK